MQIAFQINIFGLILSYICNWQLGWLLLGFIFWCYFILYAEYKIFLISRIGRAKASFFSVQSFFICYTTVSYHYSISHVNSLCRFRHDVFLHQKANDIFFNCVQIRKNLIGTIRFAWNLYLYLYSALKYIYNFTTALNKYNFNMTYKNNPLYAVISVVISRYYNKSQYGGITLAWVQECALTRTFPASVCWLQRF